VNGVVQVTNYLNLFFKRSALGEYAHMMRAR